MCVAEVVVNAVVLQRLYVAFSAVARVSVDVTSEYACADQSPRVDRRICSFLCLLFHSHLRRGGVTRNLHVRACVRPCMHFLRGSNCMYSVCWCTHLGTCVCDTVHTSFVTVELFHR